MGELTGFAYSKTTYTVLYTRKNTARDKRSTVVGWTCPAGSGSCGEDGNRARARVGLLQEGGLGLREGLLSPPQPTERRGGLGRAPFLTSFREMEHIPESCPGKERDRQRKRDGYGDGG